MSLLGVLVMGAVVFHLLYLEIIAPLLLVYGLPPLILTFTSIGLWQMKKWGGVLYGVYLGLEVVRSLLTSSIPFVTLPIGFALVDLYQGQTLATQYNTIYLVCIAAVGVGVVNLWFRGRLH
jgi:uncharacterized membrane protein (DUF2068 family)